MCRRPLSAGAVAVVVAVVAGSALVGCGGDGDDEGSAQGLFESQGVIDWDPVATRAELAARSDRVVPFEAADLAGLCESTEHAFEEDAAGEFATPEEAAAGLVRDSFVLRGLDLADGVISLRGEPVGTYLVVPRPGNTYAVERAEWCYPD